MVAKLLLSSEERGAFVTSRNLSIKGAGNLTTAGNVFGVNLFRPDRRKELKTVRAHSVVRQLTLLIVTPHVVDKHALVVELLAAGLQTAREVLLVDHLRLVRMLVKTEQHELRLTLK